MAIQNYGSGVGTIDTREVGVQGNYAAGREMGALSDTADETVGEFAGTRMHPLKEYLRRNSVKSLLIAVGVGCVLGGVLLLRRQSQARQAKTFRALRSAFVRRAGRTAENALESAQRCFRS